MLWRIGLCLIFVVASVAQAGIWPEQFAGVKRTNVKPLAVQNAAIWDEYGLEESEQAVYGTGAKAFTASAWRLADATCALAAFQWQRPADAHPSALGKLAAETDETLLLAFGNYLFRFEGRRFEVRDFPNLFDTLPRLDQSSLPVLSDYLPTANLAPNSERYVLGPVALKAFEPRIPASVAAFHYGTEAQLGKFHTGKSETVLALFSYPTPQIARERIEAFQKIPNVMAKRSGPLIAVVVAPPDSEAAERLLSRIRYKAQLSWTDYKPANRDNIGDLILTIFSLIGVMLLFCIASGLLFGGMRILLRRLFGNSDADGTMTVLRIRDR
ncbi:MAG: DUF6599 family protein [Bryobacteraceae bacterium]